MCKGHFLFPNFVSSRMPWGQKFKENVLSHLGQVSVLPSTHQVKAERGTSCPSREPQASSPLGLISQKETRFPLFGGKPRGLCIRDTCGADPRDPIPSGPAWPSWELLPRSPLPSEVTLVWPRSGLPSSGGQSQAIPRQRAVLAALPHTGVAGCVRVVRAEARGGFTPAPRHVPSLLTSHLHPSGKLDLICEQGAGPSAEQTRNSALEGMGLGHTSRSPQPRRATYLIRKERSVWLGSS